MSLTLRPANPSELPAVVALMNRAFRGTGPQASWNTEAVFIEGDRTTLPLLQAELAAKPAAVLLVAREVAHGDSQEDAQEDQNPESPIRGCVLLEPLAAGTWYLGSLTVDPTLQNAGLGRRLLAAAEDWAQRRGATRIQMTVVNVRDTLIAWYQRRGYGITGETRPFPYGDTRFGIPKRNDLAFVILERVLPTIPNQA